MTCLLCSGLFSGWLFTCLEKDASCKFSGKLIYMLVLELQFTGVARTDFLT